MPVLLFSHSHWLFNTQLHLSYFVIVCAPNIVSSFVLLHFCKLICLSYFYICLLIKTCAQPYNDVDDDDDGDGDGDGESRQGVCRLPAAVALLAVAVVVLRSHACCCKHVSAEQH